MGVPRPPVHLAGNENTIRALDVGTHSKDDTGQLANYANKVSGKFIANRIAVLAQCRNLSQLHCILPHTKGRWTNQLYRS